MGASNSFDTYKIGAKKQKHNLYYNFGSGNLWILWFAKNTNNRKHD